MSLNKKFTQKIFKIALLILLQTIFYFSAYSQNKKENLPQPNISILESEVKHLKDSIYLQNKRYDSLDKIVNTSFNSISNQLSIASFSLTFFGILFSIFGIILGVYISNLEKKTVKINEENKEFLNKNKEMKRDVEELNKLIQSDINGLYLKIKREEICNILDRLIKIPEDISNVCTTLFSNDLLPGDFSKLRNAYLNFNSKTRPGASGYHTVFFQHFFGQALKDIDLRKAICSSIYQSIIDSFQNDLMKSSNDFMEVLVEIGIEEYKIEITNFFQGLNSSTDIDLNSIFAQMIIKLDSNYNRILLFDQIENSSTTKFSKMKFGKLLIKELAKENLSNEVKIIVYEMDILEKL